MHASIEGITVCQGSSIASRHGERVSAAPESKNPLMNSRRVVTFVFTWKEFSRKGAKAQRRKGRGKVYLLCGSIFAPLRLCGRKLLIVSSTRDNLVSIVWPAHQRTSYNPCAAHARSRPDRI